MVCEIAQVAYIVITAVILAKERVAEKGAKVSRINSS
jgi:hypothetical protein